MSAYHIIGDSDTVLGYRFAGVPGDIARNAEEALAAFGAAVADPDIAVLIVTEAVEDMIPEAVMRHRLEAKPPYVTTVEDIWGPRGNRKSLQTMINEAVGVRIAQDDGEDSEP